MCVCTESSFSKYLFGTGRAVFYSPQFNCQLIFNFLMLSAQCISTTEPIPPAL